MTGRAVSANEMAHVFPRAADFVTPPGRIVFDDLPKKSNTMYYATQYRRAQTRRKLEELYPVIEPRLTLKQRLRSSTALTTVAQ
jgi:hypothetical protein